MEIPHVRAFNPAAVGPLSADVLQQGIAQRLKLLTYLLCPDAEEDPEQVLQRMRIDIDGPNAAVIRYRPPRSKYPLRVTRFVGAALEEQVKMAEFGLRQYPAGTTGRARAALSETIECVGFSLSTVDRYGMGWPLAIAAAAKLAELGNGVIDTNDFGWVVPNGDEISWIVEPLKEGRR
jgi:hypothetical protein